MQAFIRAIACHLPEKILTNEDLAHEFPSLDINKICKKVGIQRRRIVAAGETASDLGFAAARKLLDGVGVDRASIDALIFCTQSPDNFLPASGCLLQNRLGLSTKCAVVDISHGCTGYIYGLWLAKGLVSSGLARNVLIVTAETYSRYLSPQDWGVRVIFGDGASASMVSADGPGSRIEGFALGTDGGGAENLIVKAGAARKPPSAETRLSRADDGGVMRNEEQLLMDGPELFSFTLKRVPEIVGQVLASQGLEINQIDHFVFHQANEFMNESLRTKLKIPKEKAPLFLCQVGNTVSSTIPLVLSEVGGEFAHSARVMLVGFGVGYSWGACLTTWGPVHLLPFDLSKRPDP